ncbi:hypothetical protein U1Q18_020641 [Sarracenia purpurea var. burkii]
MTGSCFAKVDWFVLREGRLPQIATSIRTLGLVRASRRLTGSCPSKVRALGLPSGLGSVDKFNYQRRGWRGRIGRRSRGVSRRGSFGSPEMVDGDCVIEGDSGFSGGSFEGEWCLTPWVGGDGGSPEEVAGGVCRHQSRGRR